jgi:hypothetical protein
MEWVSNAEPSNLRAQTAGVSNDWNQSRPDPKLRELDFSSCADFPDFNQID